MTTIVPVILSGGSGTRLLPASTRDTPKQFQPLVGENSMFRQTLDRVTDRTRFAPPMIVCGAAHVAHVEADLAAAAIDDALILVEPGARNTAPRSEEHTSELQSLMRYSYAVFCLTKKTTQVKSH